MNKLMAVVNGSSTIPKVTNKIQLLCKLTFLKIVFFFWIKHRFLSLGVSLFVMFYFYQDEIDFWPDIDIFMIILSPAWLEGRMDFFKDWLFRSRGTSVIYATEWLFKFGGLWNFMVYASDLEILDKKKLRVISEWSLNSVTFIFLEKTKLQDVIPVNVRANVNKIRERSHRMKN